MAVPAARYLAKERGVDLAGIRGTGPDGVILAKDVEAAAGASPGATGAAPKEVPVRVSTLARKLAEKEGVPLEKVEGTGVRGRVMRADVSAYAGRLPHTLKGLLLRAGNWAQRSQ